MVRDKMNCDYTKVDCKPVDKPATELHPMSKQKWSTGLKNFAIFSPPVLKNVCQLQLSQWYISKQVHILTLSSGCHCKEV